MLMPKRVKRRKQFRGTMTGKAMRGNKISNGDSEKFHDVRIDTVKIQCPVFLQQLQEQTEQGRVVCIEIGEGALLVGKVELQHMGGKAAAGQDPLKILRDLCIKLWDLVEGMIGKDPVADPVFQLL